MNNVVRTWSTPTKTALAGMIIGAVMWVIGVIGMNIASGFPGTELGLVFGLSSLAGAAYGITSLALGLSYWASEKVRKLTEKRHPWVTWILTPVFMVLGGIVLATISSVIMESDTGPGLFSNTFITGLILSISGGLIVVVGVVLGVIQVVRLLLDRQRNRSATSHQGI